MKQVNLFVVLLFSLLSCGFISCKDGNVNDNPKDPSGTVTLNMLNEEHGETLLGESDVFIDKANNFYGPSCEISSLGKKNGLGSITDPVLQAISSKVAVEHGCGYQIFRSAALRQFPSGQLALDISGDYYNAYVVSPIRENEQTMQNGPIIGAVVKFALAEIPKHDLPQYNSFVGTLERNRGNVLRITLPSPFFEYEPDEYTPGDLLRLTKVGEELEITLSDHIYKNQGSFGIYIRIGDSFTNIKGKIQN